MDILHQGGCEGIIHAVQILTSADLDFESSMRWSSNHHGCYLFEKVMSSNYVQARCAAQLIMVLGFSTEPRVLERLLCNDYYYFYYYLVIILRFFYIIYSDNLGVF